MWMNEPNMYCGVHQTIAAGSAHPPAYRVMLSLPIVVIDIPIGADKVKSAASDASFRQFKQGSPPSLSNDTSNTNMTFH